MTKHSDRIRFY